MTDERGRSLQAQLQFMERNGRALEELVAKMLRVREEQESFFTGFARALQDVGAQEASSELAQCLASLGECGQRLALETHDVMLQRPEAEVLLALAHIQDWGIVPMKRLLDDREKAVKMEARLQKEYDEKRGGSGKEKERKLRVLSDQKRRVENANALIDYHMRKFDEFRLAKMKKVLDELARSHLFYHAKGLELFSAPCAQIAKLPLHSGAAASEI